MRTNSSKACRAPTGSREAGMTLIELMVALAIGLFLLLGAMTVYLQSRQTFQVNETIARLQENGRFALDAIEPDIRMGHFWGLTTRTDKIQGRAAPTETNALAFADDCGDNWSFDLDAGIEASNGSYGWDCDAYGDGAQGSSDTLVVRRAAEEATATPVADTLYIQSARFQDSQIFEGAAIPSGYSSTTSETHELVVDGYYVSQSSTLGDDVPSLRVKRLGVGPAITDEEVLPGVEDMQVQLGVDTDAFGSPNRGSIDLYVNPGDAILANPDVQVLAVRIWLRIRAERPEPGFTDDRSYTYADQDIDPPMDGYRRIVVSKTIYIRNARPPA
ncbi:MAG TPA: PilW family protein [Gammaproteobacteria bacterium]|nr:PilW family protein [Gammaproteobacteria bacterium]